MDPGVQLTLDNPKKKANVFSKMFFTWMLGLYKKGITDGLAMTDLYKTLDCDSSEMLGDKLEAKWNEELAKAKLKSKEPSFVMTIVRTFFWQYMICGIFVFFQFIVFRTAQPIVLAYLIKLFAPTQEKDDDLQTKMYIAGSVMVGIATILIFLFHHTTLAQMCVGMRVRVAVSSLIYRKMLRLNKKSLGQTPSGKVVNLLSNDVSRFDFLAFSLHFLWIAPFQVAIVAYFIWEEVGVSSLAGILSMVLLTVPMQAYLGKLMSTVRTKIAVRTDKRVKIMNEIISGIQVIKMYAWEKPFEAMVRSLRLHEVNVLTSAAYIRGFFLSCMVFIERTTLYLTLLSYTLLGNTITADGVFSMSQFFNLLQLALAIYLPNVFSLGAETLVACKRLKDFLMMDEITESSVSVVENGEKIKVSEVDASWPAEVEVTTLSGIDFEIPAGKLCAVIGPVGAGKSSLLQLLLGELTSKKGSVSVCGNISYASQEPWLFVSSVRNNILFGKEYDRRLYDEVARVCALLPDFKQFPNGDRTIVGERGVSLSGGQRARINLARAVYRSADIYMLDDPLSAVDTHVGKHLFDECIVGYLKGKTRILVTHQLQFLKKADLIIVLNGGKIEAMGTFQDLAKSDIDITKMMVAADETTDEEKKPKVNREVSRSVSVMSSNTMSSVDDKDDVVEENVEELGLVGKSAFKEYFKAAGNACVLITVFSMIILGQAFASGADYWVSFWTDQEELKMENNIETPDVKYPILDRFVTMTQTIVPHSDHGTIAREPVHSTNWPSLRNILFDEPIDTYLALYIYTGIIVLLILFNITRCLAFFKITMTASKNLHSYMFHCLLKARMRFFDTNPSGRILNRFSKDIGVVDEVLPRILMETIQILLVMVGILVMVSITNYYMIAAIVFFGALFIVLRKYYLKTAKVIKHIEGASKSPVFSHLNSSLNGITTIRVCRAEHDLRKEFDHHQDVNTSAWYLNLSCIASFGLWLDIIAVLFTACVVYSFIILHQYGNISGSMVGLAISQSLILTGMLQYGVRQSAEVVNQMASVERILQYTTLDEEGPFEGPEHKEWPKSGAIKFKQMNMKYAQNEPPVLHDLNIEVKSGEKVGIVGRTGAGKSSLISAVFRLAYIEGLIEVDDLDCNTIGLTELRRKLSIIPQEPVLFSASLRYNLDPFNEYDDRILWSALEEVELKEVVPTLDFIVEEGGGNFSLGQRQLICLARAILRNNKILVLDEATANVDLGTDELIQKTIRRKFANCTVLTIAHRLNTIMDSDKVLVMDKGTMVEYDHPHVLLKNDEGHFTGMVKQTGPSMTNTLREIARKAYQEKYQTTKTDEQTKKND